MQSANRTPLPKGYNPIPLEVGSSTMSVRVSIIVRENPDPTSGHLVRLRQIAEADVFLGVICDHAGYVLEWLEVWVQKTGRIDPKQIDYENALNNVMLDKRWENRVEILRKSSPETFIESPWQSENANPLYLDLAKKAPFYPLHDQSETRWELCRDDVLLFKAGLPEYSSSIYRYLYVPQLEGSSPFLPLSDNAPESKHTESLSKVLDKVNYHIPFNPECGRLILRKLAPLNLSDFIDLLGGKPWAGMGQAADLVKPLGVYSTICDNQQVKLGSGRLFAGLRGWRGRLIETFHLKVRLLQDLISKTRAAVQQQQAPILTLDTESFNVGLSSMGKGMPYLWSFENVLSQTGECFLLPIEDKDYSYFKPLRRPNPSVFRPIEMTQSQTLQGTVTLRKQEKDRYSNNVFFDGTLETQELRVEDIKIDDLFYFQIPIATGRLCLFALVDTSEGGLTPGRIRFRSVGQSVPAKVLEIVNALYGTPIPYVPFEKHPSIKSPGDLYSLAMLAVRIFLVDESTVLSSAVDDLRSLTTDLRMNAAGEDSMGELIAKMVEENGPLLDRLGPHRLVHDTLKVEDALKVISPNLWWELIGFIIRLIPGAIPASYCSKLGEGQPFALETVFDEPLQEIDRLARQTLSLCVVDWTYNREVSTVIRSFKRRIELV